MRMVAALLLLLLGPAAADFELNAGQSIYKKSYIEERGTEAQLSLSAQARGGGGGQQQ